MVVPRRACGWFRVAGSLVIGLLCCVGASRGEEFRLESVGVRGGVGANFSSRYFNQVEAFGNWYLPWGWDLGNEWRLRTRLGISVGRLGEHADGAALGSIGPSLVLGWNRLPLTLEGGVIPTFLSSDLFQSKNFGSEVQFTSYVGLSWRFAAHWCLDGRFQHMSNAGLASHNPGLNMVIFGAAYRF
jgi:hypothetical protein